MINEESEIKVLDWIFRSSFETIYGTFVIKKFQNYFRSRNREALLQQVWRINFTYTQNLVESMNQRLEGLLDTDEDTIKY